MAVDEPAKIRLDAEKRKTVLSISSNDSLSGLEAQVDILSGVVIGLIERLSVIQPELRQELLQETPLQKFEQVYKDTAITNLKDADSTLDEMKRQKTAVRKEQKRYFGERDKILGIKILKNTK
jgi:hypothetical protein